MQNNKIIWIGGLIVIIFIIWIAISTGGPGKLDAFVSCLDEKGTKFYGAFWCPHCASQKAMFGKSAKLLPYVECSTPDGKGQLQVCKDKNITNYPTWDFLPIGEATTTTRLTGEIALVDLAEKTGCTLPPESR